jgi:hypothetical protein
MLCSIDAEFGTRACRHVDTAPVPERAAIGPASSSSSVTGNGSVASSAAGFKGAPLSRAERKAAFLAQWGGKYGYGGRIDELYRSEIGCRLPEDQHFLDYTGSALYCRTPLQAAFNDLQVRCFKYVRRLRVISINTMVIF